MSRYQDAVIDDDDESCPLCIEEFDLGDKNFKPCPCGYQICQFCFNSLKITYEKSTCPNCRRPYDEATIQYKIPTAEELKLDQLNKNKKAAAAKRKETEKREVEASTRRNLAGVRVKQQNLVYVIGLEPTKKDEASLMETLRGKDYFGQYGPIEKVVVSKPKSGALNQGVGVYVTFKNKEDAATCINCVDGSPNGDKILRAQYGTTKYCSTYLRGDICQNKNCSFLHENGEDGHSTSLQNEPIEPRTRMAPTRSQPTPQPTSTPVPAPLPAAQSMARENSREGATSRQDSIDGSALPASVGWAHTPAVARARRGSQAASTSTASPQLTHASLVHKKNDSMTQPEVVAQPPSTTQSPQVPEPTVPTTEQLRAAIIADAKPATPSAGPFDAIFEGLKSAISNPNMFPLTFDDSCLTPEVREAIAALPPLFDPYGGAKRRVLQNKQAEYQAKIEAEEKRRIEEQAKSAAEDAMEEENVIAGSLALGGEPEDNPRSASTRGAIGRPAQQTSSIPIDQLSNLSLSQGRSLTPQQRQQIAMLNASASQAMRLPQQPTQNTAFELSDFDRRGPNLSQAQYDQINTHARHGSRYFNNNEAKTNNSRFVSQQSQQPPFYTSGVQGPPPGLPTAGTPPISGGGMFAHGQGFTSSGFGAAKDSDNLRTRNGTNIGHDVKRNQDYPPLPKAIGLGSPIHSRVSSIQSAFAQRTNTPKVPPGFERSTSSIDEIKATRTPPGFENLHAHPPRTDDVEVKPTATKQASSTPVLPVVPDIPLISKSRKSSFKTDPRTDILEWESSKESRQPVQTQVETENENEGKTKEVKDESSTGILPTPSNVQDSAAAINEDQSGSTPDTQSKIQPTPLVENRTEPVTESKPEAEFEVVSKVSKKAKGPKTITATTQKHSRAAEEFSIETPATLSRVNTPSPKKQTEEKRPAMAPRTLHITTEMLARSASQAHVPQFTTTEKSAPFSTLTSIRQTSRQPSISLSTNLSRPSTPAASDRLVSRDVSRAGSPPPGGNVVGSAPTRAKTKNQTKKDRRDRAKKATEMSETSSVVGLPVPPTPPVQEEVAPIVARQKKQKKQKSVSKVEQSSAPNSPLPSANDTPQNGTIENKITGELPEPVEIKQEEILSPVEDSLRPESPTTTEELPFSYTLRDLCRELDRIDAKYESVEGSEAANNKHKEIQDLVQNHSVPVQKLLSELVASRTIAKDHPLFTTPPFQSPAYKLPPDSRKGQQYLDANGYSSSNVFGMVYLPTAQKRVLYNGHAVSVHSGGDRDNDLLHRALITPNGTVLRHLGVEEGQKVIDLEQGRPMHEDDYGELGMMDSLNRIEDDDYINLEGGFDELIKNGERHGICWIIDNERSNARRRAQQSRNRANVRLEDDYGLGEMPIDADEFDDEEDDEDEGDDQFDDPDEDDIDDDEEREGEDLVNGIDPDTLDDEEEYDSDNLGFDHITTESGMNLPSLPDMNLMHNMMPGSWDPSFNVNNMPMSMNMNMSPSSSLYPNRHGMYTSLASPAPDFANLPPLPPAPTQRNTTNTLAPIRQPHPHMNVTNLSVSARDYAAPNLRNISQEQLERRVKEKQRELESSRREAEKAEKALNKKNKDAARWRESVFKAAAGLAGAA